MVNSSTNTSNEASSESWWLRLQPLCAVLEQWGMPYQKAFQRLEIPMSGTLGGNLSVSHNRQTGQFEFHTGLNFALFLLLWTLLLGIPTLASPQASWIEQGVTGLVLWLSLYNLVLCILKESLAQKLKIALALQSNN
ncbi:hypothetical protein [Ferrimonas marina]|uniref:Uncharacterized protein n=1 Tax=Ferrimonas marina TaxID=299255 RepID=A0A1M5Z694_9GAMM|nr:hypothetical protein [Ferrimonas marina]SHI19608.1 hypothetical protein SAMN02745129_4712 [Ferrimonas marina]